MIRSNLSLDFGRLSAKQLGSFDEIMRFSYVELSNKLPQEWATRGKTMKANLKKLLKAYETAGTAAG